MKPLEIIKSKLIFIEGHKAYDFTKNMGQYALEVNYTNGDKDMFTTPMPEHMGSDRGDFKSTEEFLEAVNFLRSIK